MAGSLDQLRSIIQLEYARLALRLNLPPLPLDIYEINEDGEGQTTQYGTNVRNSTPGCSHDLIVLPQLDGDLASWLALQPEFPPSNWNLHSDEWPAWRTDLWHEVVHQYQIQSIGKWDLDDGKQGHRSGWYEALDAVAERFGIKHETLIGVL